MAGAETAGTYSGFDCLTMEDVDSRLEQCFNYFDNNTTKLMIYIGRYMDQRPNFGANAKQPKQDGPLYSDFRFWRGGFMGRDFLSSVKSGKFANEEKDKDEEAKEREVEQREAEMAKMQQIRRRASIINLQEKLTNDSGRRLSSVEKSNAVVSEALKLAKQEDEEEMALGLQTMFNEDLPEEEKNWKYLPYHPVANNEVDEALAEQLNIWEIDVNIKRLKQKRKKKGAKKSKNKNIYRVDKTKYVVRFIHGVLLCREASSTKTGKKAFVELIPLLREKAGLPAAAPDAKPKRRGKGIKIHGK